MRGWKRLVQGQGGDEANAVGVGQGRGEAMGAWGGNGEKMFGCRVGMGTNSCPHVTLYQRPLTVLNLDDLMQTGISLISCR